MQMFFLKEICIFLFIQIYPFHRRNSMTRVKINDNVLQRRS